MPAVGAALAGGEAAGQAAPGRGRQTQHAEAERVRRQRILFFATSAEAA